MGTKHMKLNLQYISMQIPYWMGFSVLGTFTSVFLLSRDFTNGEIGMVLSLANLLAALVQPFLASFADRMTRVRLSQREWLFCWFFFRGYYLFCRRSFWSSPLSMS